MKAVIFFITSYLLIHSIITRPGKLKEVGVYYHSSPKVELTYLVLELSTNTTLIDIKDAVNSLKIINQLFRGKTKILVNIQRYKYFDKSNILDTTQVEAYLDNLLEIDFENLKQSPSSKHVKISDDVLKTLSSDHDIVVLLITNIHKDRNNIFNIANKYPHSNKRIVVFNFVVSSTADQADHNHRGVYLYPNFSQLKKHVNEIFSLHS
ncbi:unnamed protein product [Gordionus sp. m RMFG-2023]